MIKERNYELLKEKNPYLYAKLIQMKLNNKIELILCGDGRHTLKIDGHDGRNILLNSKYGLQREIEKAVKSVDYEASMLIWIGIGMGHELAEILRYKDPILKIVVLEPRLDLLKSAMEYGDLSEILSSQDCFIYSGSVEDIRIQVNAFGMRQLLYYTGKQAVYYPPYCLRLYPDNVVVRTIQAFEDVMNYAVELTGNHPDDTLLGINHFFSNMHAILRSPVLSMLGDYYKNYPAICIAAGPSLDKNVHLLKDVQNKALIFCADAVWEKLMRIGIIPDAISSLERDKGTYRLFFKDKVQHIDERTCLLAQAVVYPETLQEFKGTPIICTRTSIAFDQRAYECIPSINTYSTGISCAHTSFGIAKALGCNPIIVIGQDLAYSEDGISHANGTYGENKRIEDFIDQGRERRYVENITRTGVIQSDQFFDMFRQWFEAEVAKDPATTYINATEGGAYIAGMQVMKLQEVIDKYLTSNTEKIRLNEALYKEKSFIPRDELRDRALKHFEAEASTLRNMEQDLMHLVKRMETLNNLYVNPKSYARLDVFAGELQSVINELDRVVAISSVFQLIVQYYIFLYRRFFYTHRNISSLDELLNMFHFSDDIISKMKIAMEKTITEYERGLSIIKNDGVCDTIDTPLLGEMYE